jgi:hypothetical protein
LNFLEYYLFEFHHHKARQKECRYYSGGGTSWGAVSGRISAFARVLPTTTQQPWFF